MNISSNVWDIKPRDFPAKAINADKISYLLRYAILAPSAHNVQPWQCKIVNNGAEIHRHPTRALDVSDPTKRQTTISLGAFVCNFVTAASAFGIKSQTDWFESGGEGGMVAKVALSGLENAQLEPKRAQDLENIIGRRVNRTEYSAKKIDRATQDSILQLNADPDLQIHLEADTNAIDKLAQVVETGTKFAFSNPAFRLELSGYVTPNNSSRRDGIPGYTANLNLISSHFLPWLMKRVDIGSPQASKEGRMIRNCSHVLTISSSTDNELAWLNSGFLFEKVALFLTERGISISLSGAAIEPPLAPNVVQKIIKTDFRPQILCRLGYSNKLPRHSPRYPVTDILLK
ncbi:MAG: nitroreductase family protein [Candidatus Berkelbacteria bacterium]|nr:nitroreductase family protein [Candidatus Berkelbacteria bacterium]